MLRDAERPHALHLVRSGLPDQILASHVELAVDSESRRRGLLGRDKLDEGAALIIAPCSSIHTFFMRFAIDAVFLDRDFRVLAIDRALGPGRIAGRRGARAVLELPAGAAQRSGVRTGEMLRVTRDGRAR